MLHNSTSKCSRETLQERVNTSIWLFVYKGGVVVREKMSHLMLRLQLTQINRTCIYIHQSCNVYIYMYRERERDTHICVYNIYTIYIYIHTYIYIYIGD